MFKLSEFKSKKISFIKDILLYLKNKKMVEPPYKKIIPKKTSQGYLSELTIFAANFDVNDITYKDECMWPYLRNHLWVQLYLLGLGKAQGKKLDPYRLQLGREQHFPSYIRDKYKKMYGIKDISELEQLDTDFLFLTVINASEHVHLSDGSIYNRITDPVYELASKIGKAKKIEIAKVRTDALGKIKKYKFKPDLIYPPIIYTSGYSANVNFHYKFPEVMKKCMPSIEFSVNTINRLFDWELHTKNYYKEILKKYSPKILFMNGFHYHAPLLSAADELGILTVDIQHGIQIGWNPLYNNWAEMPEEGYPSVPRVFLVWGNNEKEHLKNVFPSNRHKAIVGGYPWLSKQLDYYEEIEPRFLEKIRSYKKVVLITMQNQKQFPELYSSLIENANDDVLWIIRNHPKGSKFTKSNMNLSSYKNILTSDYFDQISLVRLFQVADICLSEGSTVAIEADYYGLINCLNGSEGYENYQNEIDKGLFFHINSKEEFNIILNNNSLFTKKSRANSFAKVDLEGVLKELINLSQKEY